MKTTVLREREKRKATFERVVPKEVKKWVLRRSHNTCQMCGCVAGDVDNRSRPLRLTVGQIVSEAAAGDGSPTNLEPSGRAQTTRKLCLNGS